MDEKQQKEQEHEEAWCPICKRHTIFVSHADFSNKWICTRGGCFGYTTKKLIKSAPLTKKWI